MKALLILLTAVTTLGVASFDAGAKEYVVKNIGKGGLKASCGRGGGTFTDGENSYACTYGNGNIRECSKRDGHCIMVTPSKLTPSEQDPTNGFDQLTTMGATQFLRS